MQETTIILMLKDGTTGTLIKELDSVTITGNAALISNVFVSGTEAAYYAHVFLTVAGEVADWEFQAVYDYYDTDVFAAFGTNFGAEIKEIEDCENPSWELIFPYIRDNAGQDLSDVLRIHEAELLSTLEAIRGLESEYNAL